MKTAEQFLKEHNNPVISVSPGTAIKEALQIMTERNIGSILIKESGKVVGIWTERDLMRNVLQPGFNIETALIKDFMTTRLHYAEHDDILWRLNDKFLGLRIRHLLVRKNGEFIGMISSGDVSKYELNEKMAELNDLNHKISWEYYENWRW